MKLTQKEALHIVHTVLAELEKRNKHAIVAVVDSHGELLSFLRMEKAKLSSITIAINKAYTSAKSQRTTAELGKNAKDPLTGFDISYYGDPRFTGFGGGVPIRDQGVVIGAVGVSGLSQEEDEEVATIGISSLSQQLL
jgi:glc operon protein GlcG